MWHFFFLDENNMFFLPMEDTAKLAQEKLVSKSKDLRIAAMAKIA